MDEKSNEDVSGPQTFVCSYVFIAKSPIAILQPISFKFMKNKLSILFVTCIFVYLNAYAEDTVLYLNPVTGSLLKSSGMIESYSRYELSLRTSSGNKLSVKTDNIVEIIADYPAPYTEAELRMNNQEYDQAVSLLEKALSQVSDGWMKSKILAKQVECLTNLNRIDDAVNRYVQLISLDPNTAFYDSVPLVWTSVELSSRTVQSAQNWIRYQQNPYVALLKASLFLNSDKKSEAQTDLKALANSDDRDIATLAQMQLNRVSLQPMTDVVLINLEKKADALPKSLQYGPRFVLAQLWSRSSAAHEIKADKIALNYLQCATNTKATVELQARSFYSAGASLFASDRRDEALRIFNRLIEKYPDSQWALQAKRTADGKL